MEVEADWDINSNDGVVIGRGVTTEESSDVEVEADWDIGYGGMVEQSIGGGSVGAILGSPLTRARTL